MPPAYRSPPASGYYQPGQGGHDVYAKTAPDGAGAAQEMPDQSFLHGSTHELPGEGGTGTELSTSDSTRRR